MRYDFSDRPLYRFSERSIEDVFGDRTVAGAFILHISRSLYAGTTCVMAAGDLRQALLDELRSRPVHRANCPWRYWRYLSPHPPTW